MQQPNFFVDIHCHPTFRPYTRSFKKAAVNSHRHTDRHSIWYYQRPGFFKRLINRVASITPFQQGSFSQFYKGNTRVVCAALYPMEQAFVNNRLGSGLLAHLPNRLIAGLNRQRTRNLRSLQNFDYFNALQHEFQWLVQLNEQRVKTPDGSWARYKLVRSFEEIQQTLHASEEPTIAVVLTIEGAHSFGTGLSRDSHISPDLFKAQILEHVDTVKKWAYKPLFVTFAHFFDNELCGHASTIDGLARGILNQDMRLNEGFSQLGIQVLDRLMDNTDGNRILIDIKHMSRNARLQYYAWLESQYPNECIPIIASHGAVSGLPSDPTPFNNDDINFHDDEIIRIAQTRGLFGLQLDERRIASTAAIKAARTPANRRKRLHRFALLAWKQIQHVAQLLDNAGLPALDILCLGTDFDGQINPIKGYWTTEELEDLAFYLHRHAQDYLDDNHFQHSFNEISADEVIAKVMSQNAMRFFEKNM